MRVRRVPAEGRHDDEQPRPAGGPRHLLRAPRAARRGPWPITPGRMRPRSVRAKIVSLLMVPVISLMALWAFATVTTAQSVSDLTQLKQLGATLLEPVSDYITAVQAERSAAARYLAHPDTQRLDALDSRGRGTEAAARALRRGISASSVDTAALSSELPARTRRLTDAAGRLPELRKQVTTRKKSWGDAYTGYSDAIDLGFSVDGALSGVSASVAGQGRGSEIASQARVVQELSRAREMIAREDAIVGGSQADGQMPMDRYRSFVGAVQAQRSLFQSSVDDLRPSDETAYRTVLAEGPYRELGALERTIEDAGPGRATHRVSTVAWDHAAGPVLGDLHTAQAGASTVAAHDADPLASDVLGRSGIAVVLGLVGVLLSLVISMRIGRGLVVELVDMRNSALELAGSKLPASLRRLHAGEEVDVDAEAPVQRRGEDEIGQVGAALNAVHRAAIQAAVERAEVLSGISDVYVKLARRSQVLLHRQLNLLDTMERRVEDPTDLEDLFRLDHLTTRMRRHAESLIILSGAAPVRGWRRPVPVLDVVRSAVAEVEDFTRVEVRVAGDVHLAGSAVADLTHLVAELVENAVAFSPPHTKVQVRGERVGAGMALEVEDRGLGMSRQAMAQANRKIMDPSEVDLLDTDRLGLFVVNRLAHRRGVQVALQPSAYGGVTAVVLVPESVLEQPAAQAKPADQVPEGGPATVELPPFPGPDAGHQPLPAPAGPPSPRVPRQRTAVPPRPPFEPFAPEPARPAASRHDTTAFPPPPAWQPTVGRPAEAPPAPVQEPPAPRPVDAPPAPVQDPSVREPADARTAPATAPADGPPAHAREHPTDAPVPLPQRVRQANLAPELRDAPPRPPGAAPHIADPAVTERSPERARATMAALRAGWLSGGRANAEADRDPAPNAAPTEEDRPGPPAWGPGRSETPSQGEEA